MFDEKILMILLPVWLAIVLVSLYWGATRPQAVKLVLSLLERDCHSPEQALSLQELGVKRVDLRKGSALRRVVALVDEPSPSPEARDAVPLRCYIPPEATQKARAMYGKNNAKLWQALLWIPVITAFFLALWILASLVLDTTGWTPLFRI